MLIFLLSIFCKVLLFHLLLSYSSSFSSSSPYSSSAFPPPVLMFHFFLFLFCTFLSFSSSSSSSSSSTSSSSTSSPSTSFSSSLAPLPPLPTGGSSTFLLPPPLVSFPLSLTFVYDSPYLPHLPFPSLPIFIHFSLALSILRLSSPSSCLSTSSAIRSFILYVIFSLELYVIICYVSMILSSTLPLELRPPATSHSVESPATSARRIRPGMFCSVCD